MHEPSHSAFQLTQLIPVLKDQQPHVAMTILSISLLLMLTGLAGLKLRKSKLEDLLIPSKRLHFLNFWDVVAEALFKMTQSILGSKEAIHYFPVIGSLFLLVFTSNFLGLFPFFSPANDNLNTTLALGFFVFFYYQWVGFRTHGLAYLKHFMGPVVWLAPLMLIIEIASHLFRPLSLALRLKGNIMGDHIVLGVFSDLVPYVIPMIFYGLGAFVSFLQAFVFCLMSMVYISLSTSNDH